MVSGSAVDNLLTIQHARITAIITGGNFTIAIREAMIAPLPAKVPTSTSAAINMVIVFIWITHVYL